MHPHLLKTSPLDPGPRESQEGSNPLDRGPDARLLEPGWAGDLSDEELTFIQQALLKDARLSRTWGFRPSQKTRNEQAIRRVGMDGDPENIAHNRRLARPRRAHQTKSSPTSIAKKFKTLV